MSLYTVQIKDGPIFNVQGAGISIDPADTTTISVVDDAGKRLFTAPVDAVSYIRELQP